MPIGKYPRKPLAIRFWALVDIKGEDDCWPWKGKKGPKYGHFASGDLLTSAHRWAWALVNNGGVLPDTKVHIRHSSACTTKLCCNPAHLKPGTASENMMDKWETNSMPHGSLHYRAKLTDDEAIRIYQDPRDQRTIALSYSVSQTTVSKIKRRKAWAHVTK